ncbi:MAG: hypothetical protein ACOC8Y_01335 [Candidatus Natronoplasma sp.]
MRWEYCLENKVFERKEDISAAESLFSIAKTRIKDNEKRERKILKNLKMRRINIFLSLGKKLRKRWKLLVIMNSSMKH